MMKTRAGQSTREMAERRYRARLRFVLPLATIVLVIPVVIFFWPNLGFGGLGIFGLIVVAELIMAFLERNVKRMKKEERRAIRGAKAEERIGELLEGLGDGYAVLNDVVSPFGNIDHVVLSDRGDIFLVETKSHGGRVSVANGQLLLNGHAPEKDFLAQVLQNTYWLRDRVQQVSGSTLWITPLLVFTNAFVERGAPLKGVVVLNRKYLPEMLRGKTSARNQKAWECRDAIIKALSQPVLSPPSPSAR